MTVLEQADAERWTLYHADTVDVARGLPADSVGLSVFSPPFASLFTYSDSPRDMGNSASYAEFFEAFGFLVAEQARVMKPGGTVAMHCMDVPTSKVKDGYIGLRDFPGDLLRAYQAQGFVYHSRVTVWKDPVVAMMRTKALGLLHKQLRKDSSMSRQGIPDYLIIMRKPGGRVPPLAHTHAMWGALDSNGNALASKSGSSFVEALTAEDAVTRWESVLGDDVNFSVRVDAAPSDWHNEFGDSRESIDKWQRYASPVWVVTGAETEPCFLDCHPDIDMGDTLNAKGVREEKDEAHLAPLQLEVIRRCVRLWSHVDDIVWSPFAGIGSEGYVAVQEGRRFIGAELKRSYYLQAVANLRAAEKPAAQDPLFPEVTS